MLWGTVEEGESGGVGEWVKGRGRKKEKKRIEEKRKEEKRREEEGMRRGDWFHLRERIVFQKQNVF